MNHMPRDLVPLPTQPWDERPAELSLDIEECRTALWITRGNVSEAAVKLKVSSQRLRAFVKSSKRLQDTIEEFRETLKDIAETNIYEALTDPEDAQRRDGMTKFVLTNIAGDRGFGKGNGSINIDTSKSPKGRLMVVWDDGEAVTGEEEPQTIEGELHNAE